MVESLKAVLMRRDNLTEKEADEQIAGAKEELASRLAEGDMPHDFCQEEFGLEPDYLFDLLY